MYDINSNLLSKTGLTAAQLKAAEQAFSPGEGYHDDVWQAIVDAENKYGLNALFILAHADVESAHGKSYYATTRNNLFGFNAIDSDPKQASSYGTQAASIDFYASFLQSHYLTPGAVYFNGATPHGVFVKYSSSHDAEANTVVQIMNALEAHVSGQPVPTPSPAPAPTPVPSPATSTHLVSSGENLTVISAKYPGTNPDMWVNANKSKYPSITRDYIQAGWSLNVPGGNPSVPAPGSQFYTVVAGDSLSVIAARNGLSLGQIEAMNPGAGHPAGNFGNIWPGDQVRVK